MNEDDIDDESLQPGDRRENETEEEAKTRKRKERLEQNRISARESRKRKKTMIEELQRTVITLSRENKDLNERNESLRRQLVEIGGKYPDIVSLQAIIGQSAGQAPSLADQAAATAAANVATNGTGVDDPLESTTATVPSVATPGTFASYNPMAWLTSPPAPATTDSTTKAESADTSTV